MLDSGLQLNITNIFNIFVVFLWIFLGLLAYIDFIKQYKDKLKEKYDYVFPLVFIPFSVIGYKLYIKYLEEENKKVYESDKRNKTI